MVYIAIEMQGDLRDGGAGGGWGGFSPPTFEEDDILFCFSIFSIFYLG